MHTVGYMLNHMSSLFLSFGYIGLFLCIFAESGLFFGFFLPGDTLLFSAGLLSAEHILSIIPTVLLITLGAILGDTVGYWFGTWTGKNIFVREDSLFFHKKHIVRAQEFYTRYGAYTIVLARFIPIIRTFAPIVAGIGKMPYILFFLYNSIGGIAWAASITLLGYFLGTAFPSVVHYITVISLCMAALSVIPILFLRKQYTSY